MSLSVNEIIDLLRKKGILPVPVDNEVIKSIVVTKNKVIIVIDDNAKQDDLESIKTKLNGIPYELISLSEYIKKSEV